MTLRLLISSLGVLMLVDGELIREALRHANISLEKAAIWMEMDPRHLDRQLKGEGHFSLRRMQKLPMSFRRWFNLLSVIRDGLPKEAKQAAIIQFAAMGTKRQLRMELGAERKRDSA